MESVNEYESREIDSTKVISDTNLISLIDGVDRSNGHYDACVKVKSPEIHNVITYCQEPGVRSLLFTTTENIASNNDGDTTTQETTQ